MIRSILYATLIAGSLDITAACLQVWFKSGVTPDRLLRYIATGVFGKAAQTGGPTMLIWGLLFHFLIAFACTACFFWLYPKLPFLRDRFWLNALLIALTAWVVTTRIIIPMTPIKQAPFDFFNALQAIAILYFCIGLPIAWFAMRYFEAKD
jgi:hypothetical protein